MTDSHLENTLFQYNNSFLADERVYKKVDHFDNIISNSRSEKNYL